MKARALIYGCLMSAVLWALIILAAVWLTSCRIFSRGDDAGDMSSCVYNCQAVRVLPQLLQAAPERVVRK